MCRSMLISSAAKIFGAISKAFQKATPRYSCYSKSGHRYRQSVASFLKLRCGLPDAVLSFEIIFILSILTYRSARVGQSPYFLSIYIDYDIRSWIFSRIKSQYCFVYRFNQESIFLVSFSQIDYSFGYFLSLSFKLL